MSILATPQQTGITDAYKQGSNLVVEALAGTGKTSTLDLASRLTPDEVILYVAYNKAIATEAAAKFARNVDCRTAHSLAFRVFGVRYKDKLNSKFRLTAKQQAQYLGIKDYFTIDPTYDITLSPRKLARLVADTVQKFCYSGDFEILDKHVPYVKGSANQEMDQLREFIVPFARKYWEDILSQNGKLKFQHDHYLKMFQMSQPKLRYDVILFDEAQDANPCTSSMILAQNNAQLVAVGDRNQQIYGWRGAEDAMQTWPADAKLFLTKSFRFGEAVAAEANKWLELLDAPTRVEGFEKIDSTVGMLSVADINAILCRTNAGALGEAIAAVEEGRKVAIVGGTNDMKMFAEAARDLQLNDTLPEAQRIDVFHPELYGFNTWRQVQEYLQEEGDKDLEKLVKLVNDNGIDKILSICATTVDEKNADITISTAHKAKGREWHHVKIGDDFQAPDEKEEEGGIGGLNKPEMMLAYVAVTRAQYKLDVGSLDWVNRYLSAKPANGAQEAKTEPTEPVATGLGRVDEAVKREEGE